VQTLERFPRFLKRSVHYRVKLGKRLVHARKRLVGACVRPLVHRFRKRIEPLRQLVELVDLPVALRDEPVDARLRELHLQRLALGGTFRRLVRQRRGLAGSLRHGGGQVLGQALVAEAPGDDLGRPRPVVGVGGHRRHRVLARAGGLRVAFGLGRLCALHVHHQHLQAVLEVRETHVGVVVERQDLRVRVQLFQALRDAAAHDVVRQAPEGLQDEERLAAVRGMMQNLAGNQHAFAGVERVVDNRVARLHQLGHAAGRLVQRMRGGDAVAHVVAVLEQPVRDAQKRLLAQRLAHAIFLHLGILVEIRLADDVGHARLDDLEAVVLEVLLHVVVGAGVEVQQVFAHDEHARAQFAAIVFHLVHDGNRLLERLLGAARPVRLQALHQHVDGPLERVVGTARHQLVGAHLAQQLFQRVDHRQHQRDADGAHHVHRPPGLLVVIVDVVVRDDGHVLVPGVVEGLAQQRGIMREAAVADVLARGHRDVGVRVLAGFQLGQRLADDDLRGEADVVVHVLLAQANGLVAPDFQRHRAQALLREHGGHHAAERMARVGYQHHALAACGLVELLRVWVVERRLGLHRLRGVGLLQGAAHVHGLDERAHADAQRPGDVALVDLQHERRLVGKLAHDADDLVGEVSVVPAAEAHDLGIFQVGALRAQNGVRQHARMEVVHHVEARMRQVDLGRARNGVGRQHRNALRCELVGQVVVHQRVVVVGTPGEHDGVSALGLDLFEHARAFGQQLGAEGILRGVGLRDGRLHEVAANAEGLAHPGRELLLAVGGGVPVPQRVVELHAEALLGVIRIADDHRVALHHGAHRLARLFGVLGRNRGDDRHEYAVDTAFHQVAHVSVHELRREADGVGRHCGQAVLEQRAVALARELHVEAQCAPERRPERRVVPEGQHARQADGQVALLAQLFHRVILEQQLLAQLVQVGRGIGFRARGLHGVAHARVLRVAHHRAAFAAVAGDEGRAVLERDDAAVAGVAAERANRVRLLRVRKPAHRVEPDEGRGVRAVFGQALGHVTLCEQGRADGAHQPGVGRARDLAADVLLECREHGVVVEGAALHDDLLSQAREVRHADDLGEHVLDDAAAQAGHDVVGRLAVLLLGHDARVHEHGAAAAEHRGVRGAERRGGDLARGDVQRAGEAFQEAAATRRACLVHEDVGDDAVMQPDGLHVLAADVEDEARVGHAARRGERVRDGFHDVDVGVQRAVEQQLAVAGRAAREDVELHARRLVTVGERGHRVAQDVEGLALVRGIEAVDELAVFADERELRGGRARVDAQVGAHGAARREGCGAGGFGRGAMAFLEGAPVGLGCEERGSHARGLREGGRGVVQAALQRVEVDGRVFFREHAQQRERRALRDDDLGICGNDDAVGAELEALREHRHELRVEGERPALEDDGRMDVEALRQAAERLLGHGVER